MIITSGEQTITFIRIPQNLLPVSKVHEDRAHEFQPQFWAPGNSSVGIPLDNKEKSWLPEQL